MREPKEIIAGLGRAVVGLDTQAAGRLAARALEAGAEAREILEAGLTRGMEEAARRYDRGEYFVPELLLASDAFQAGLEVLGPALAGSTSQGRGSLVLGTVEGDLHEIGKNLVGMLFRASGWRVHDLGPSVTAGRFAAACREHRPDLVGLSGLMTTSLTLMPGIVAALREADPGVRVIIGGASVTAETARRVGADGYAPNAAAAVREGERLRGRGNP